MKLTVKDVIVVLPLAPASLLVTLHRRVLGSRLVFDRHRFPAVVLQSPVVWPVEQPLELVVASSEQWVDSLVQVEGPLAVASTASAVSVPMTAVVPS